MLRTEPKERHTRAKSRAMMLSSVALLFLLSLTAIVLLPFRQEGWIVAGHRVFSRIEQEEAWLADLMPKGLSSYRGTLQAYWLDEHLKPNGAPTYYNFRVERWRYTLSLIPVAPMTPAEIAEAERGEFTLGY